MNLGQRALNLNVLFASFPRCSSLGEQARKSVRPASTLLSLLHFHLPSPEIFLLFLFLSFKQQNLGCSLLQAFWKRWYYLSCKGKLKSGFTHKHLCT